MKTVVNAIVLLFLGVLLYSRYNNTPSKEAGNYKSITPDSVYNKDGTAQQNDLAFKGGMPILMKEKSTHYLKSMKVDSTKAKAMFLSKATGQNEIIEVNFSSKPALNLDPKITALFFLIFILAWALARDNKDWELRIMITVLFMAIGTLVWLSFFSETQNEVLKLISSFVLASSVISILIIIWSDANNTEVIAMITFLVLNLILLGTFSFFFLPAVAIFFSWSWSIMTIGILLFLIGLFFAKHKDEFIL